METVPRLDGHIHPLVRLQLCVTLATCGVAEMADLRARLGLSKSALSKQVAALVALGYVARARPVDDGRRVRVALTQGGREALAAHLVALVALAAALSGPARRHSPSGGPRRRLVGTPRPR